MKTCVFTITAVAVYCFLEAAVLLVGGLPGSSGYNYGTTPYYSPALFIAGQLLLIPGIAGLYSLLLYGRLQWKIRAPVLFLIAPFGAPALMFILALLLALLSDAFDIGVVPFSVVFIAIAGTLVWLLFFAIRKTGEYRVRIEASRWLAERNAKADPRERRWRSRGIRWSLWIPSITAIAVVVFLPQIWGVVSHVRTPRAGQLIGYRVPIPAAWVVLYRYWDLSTGQSNVGGIAGRALGVGSLCSGDTAGNTPLFWWSVGTEPHAEILGLSEPPTMNRLHLPNEQLRERRDFALKKARLTCGERQPDYYSNAAGQDYRGPVASLECSGNTRLRASFLGDRIYLQDFYQTLAGIAEEEELPGNP